MRITNKIMQNNSLYNINNNKVTEDQLNTMMSTGKKINHEGLLQYIISMRTHNEFHEHCVERIFTDIANRCEVSYLEVRAFYTRRGGIDINPVRATVNLPHSSLRLIRQ